MSQKHWFFLIGSALVGYSAYQTLATYSIPGFNQAYNLGYNFALNGTISTQTQQ